MTDTKVAQLSEQLNAEVENLFRLLGIAASYIDYSGNTVSLDLQNRLAVMRMMGVNFSNEEELRAATNRVLIDVAGDIVAKTLLINPGAGNFVQLRLPLSLLKKEIQWSISSESAATLRGGLRPLELAKAEDSGNDEQISQHLWELPSLEIGYYTLQLAIDNREVQSLIIVSPTLCYEPLWQSENRKLGGISTQLYSLRSARNWGIGDYGDLKELVKYCASANLDFIVLNPLHALNSQHPEQCSPYSPHDRRFLNPLYLELEAEVDFTDSEEAQRYLSQTSVQDSMHLAREAELVDYSAVALCKQAVFDKMFRHFRETQLTADTPRAQSFRNWVDEKGEGLRAFGRYEAQNNRECLDSNSEPEFHCYLQWLSDGQLEACHRLAESSGMAIGLIRDLAVGSNSTSAEVQLNPGLFNLEASIGAPPDPFAPAGQNWGLPPIEPRALQRTQFRHFIELLRTNMTNCGALRIDHVLALVRLWWCPGSDHSGHGAYVSYPADVLYAILRIESQRHRCMVIGEDLGVVPPEIRHYMDTSGVFSNAIFYFEKYDPIHFKNPDHFPQRALTMVTNHDVPTLCAWWNKADLALRKQLGLYENDDQLKLDTGARESDLIQILHWLDDQSLLPDSWRDFNIHRTFDLQLSAAIICAISRSSSQLVSVQLEDLALVQSPVNIPGTADEYPNWRRKLPVTITELFTNSDATFILEEFMKARN